MSGRAIPATGEPCTPPLLTVAWSCPATSGGSISLQFSSVQSLSHVRLFPTPWTTHSTPGLPVHHQLPEFTQTHVHRVVNAIQPSHPLIPFSSCPQSFPASGSFQMCQHFISGGQSIGVSASASVLPMNI